MPPRNDIPDPSAAGSTIEVEKLLSAVMDREQGAETARVEETKPGFQAHDFRNPPVLSARDLQKLRLHQTEFVNSLSARLSLFLRLEFNVKLTGLQTVLYQKLAQGWGNPTYLTLFKAEPARGIGVLEIRPRMGFAIVDRLMGGPGLPSDSTQEFSEIEKAILEQAAQLIVAEWCSQWRGMKELKPAILGQESNGRFVQTASPETIMLIVDMEARLGNSVEKMQLAFPFVAVEPMVKQLSQGAASVETTPAPTAKPPPKWNRSFDDVRVPVSARWQWSEVAARDLLELKVGDVLRADAVTEGQVQVCIGELPGFTAHPGVVSGKWAVEIAAPAIT